MCELRLCIFGGLQDDAYTWFCILTASTMRYLESGELG